MKITWEDRKGVGSVNGEILSEKPMLSFEYAWFLITDDTAQYVESHEYGVWNKDMTDAQRSEVVSFFTDWTPPVIEEPVPTPEELQSAKELSLREEADVLFTQPVLDANGDTWRGGLDSASVIANAADMAEFSGLTQITLRDVNRDPHVKTILEAKTVAATIGADYQTKFQAKEEALRQLYLIDLTSPTAEADIAAISISNYLP